MSNPHDIDAAARLMPDEYMRKLRSDIAALQNQLHVAFQASQVAIATATTKCTLYYDLKKENEYLSAKVDSLIKDNDAARTHVAALAGLLREAREYIAKYTSPTVTEAMHGSIVDRIDAAAIAAAGEL